MNDERRTSMPVTIDRADVPSFSAKLAAFVSELSEGEGALFQSILRATDGEVAGDVQGYFMGLSIGIMNPFYLNVGGESAYWIVGDGPTQVRWGSGIANDHRGSSTPQVNWGGNVANDHRSGH